MFADFLTGSASGADRGLPLRGDYSTRLLPWIVGFSAYLVVLGIIALVLTADAISLWDRTLGRTLTLQVPADTSGARMESTLALLRQTRGVKAERVLDQSETIRLLQPWLGSNVPTELLPLPRLVDIEIDPDAVVDAATLQQQLGSVVPEAKHDDERGWLIRLHRFARRIQLVIAGLLIVSGAIGAAAAVFSANASFAIHRSEMELLRLLGAGDAYIANRYQAHALRLGFFGGIGAALAAAVSLLMLASATDSLGFGDSPPITIADWRWWLIIVAAIPVAALVTTVATRLVVARRLNSLP